MSNIKLYAEPRRVESPDDCFFYHFMDLPQAGTVGTTWDLRTCVDAYLGGIDYRQKRVLDVGTASGYLTFEMEKRGANVVSFDMGNVEAWNFVPHYSLTNQWPDIIERRTKSQHKMQNAYWYMHRQLESKARVHYGNVYDLPLELGNFDVVFLGMILPHLRDPFQALHSASRLASDLIVVTNPGGKSRWYDRLLGRNRFQAKFVPSAANNNCDVWWALSDSCIIRMLETLGFEVVDRVVSQATCHAHGTIRQRKSQAIVARRVAGAAAGIAAIRPPAEQRVA